MNSISERILFLLNRYTDGLASVEETRELFVLLKDQDQGEQVKNKVRDLWEGYDGLDASPVTDWPNMYDRIVATPVIRERRFAWARLAAAAAVLLVLGGSLFYLINRDAQPEEALTTTGQMAPSNDALPGQNKATLTIASGEKIVLDSAALGKLTVQGGMDVLNQGDGLTYAGKEVATAPVYNTLITQRGEQYSLTLADGTKAWLNAASSIRFPVAFTGNERMVEITGEVYFEVAHQPNKPFVVRKPGDQMAVQVLGTHFNVNAYDDEDMIKVSLLEGSVQVTNGGSAGLLKPGQQAQVTDGVKVIDGVDLEAVMSWKNGYFSFSHTDLPTMLRQLSRWYNVDVVFETSVPEMKIGGGITRNTNLSQVLTILEEMNVKFRIEGKKLIVRK